MFNILALTMNIFGNCLCVFLLCASVSLGAVEGSQDELLARIDALEKREKVHSAQIHRLEQQNQEYNQQLKNLQETNVLLRKDIGNTNSQLQDTIKVIDELKEKNKLIEFIQKEIENMQKKVNTREEIVKPLQADVNHLLYGVTSSKERVHSTNNAASEKYGSLIRERKDDEGNNVDDISTIQSTFTKEVKKTGINSQKVHPLAKFSNTEGNRVSSNKRQAGQLNGSVAFHAVLTPHLNQLTAPQTIVFDDALLNLGNSYHVQHGLFIAPKSGLYLFSASITSANVHFWASILKNGEVLVGIIAPDVNDTIQGSATVITQLNQGDEVWVRHDHPPNSVIWGNYYTSFCGILLIEN